MIALLQRTALKFSAERGCLREGEWISNFRFREPSPHSRAFGDEWRVLDPPQQLYRFAEADDRSDDTQQHGGTIEVDSEDRRIHRIYNTPAAQPAEVNRGANSRDDRIRFSILVVDDEPDVADLFRQRFRRKARQGTYAPHFRRLRTASSSSSRALEPVM